jgi:hypothetical protein
MRRHSVLSFTVILSACASDPSVSSQTGDATPDVTVDSGDASTDVGRIDANDATTDAGSPDIADVADVADVYDAGPAPVTVVVRNEFALESGVTVVFQDATGAVIGTATTDATGSAAMVVPAGSQVTALIGTASAPSLTTVTEVAPGDVITIGDAADKSTFDAFVSIGAVPPSPPANTAQYFVQAGSTCGNNFTAPPGQLEIHGKCEAAGHVPLLVVAADTSADTLAYSYLTTFVVTDDAGVGDASAPSAAITQPWQTAMINDSLTLTNVGAITGVDLSSEEIAAGVPYAAQQYVNLSTGDAGVAPTVFPHHPGYADAIQDEALERTFSGSFVYGLSLTQTFSAPTADSTTTFDLSTMLPSISATSIDATPSARPTVTWTAPTPVGNAGGFVMFGWSTPTDGGNVSGTWTIVVPASATSVIAPALPAALAAWAPTPTSYWSPHVPSAAFVDGSALTSYSVLRNTFVGFASGFGSGSDGDPPVLPPGTTLRVSYCGQDDG